MDWRRFGDRSCNRLGIRGLREFRRRVVEGSPKDRRRIAEGATKEDFGGHKCPPTGQKRTRKFSRQNRDTQWKGWRGARKKKKKPPKRKKAPNKKRETAACGSACLRAAAPPSSLASFLSSFGGCAASFSCPLRASLSSCGRLRRPSSLLLLSRFFRAAAPPYPFRFSSVSSAAAPPLSYALSWAAGAAPSLPSLFPLYQIINNPLTPSHVMNFFSFAFFLD